MQSKSTFFKKVSRSFLVIIFIRNSKLLPSPTKYYQIKYEKLHVWECPPRNLVSHSLNVIFGNGPRIAHRNLTLRCTYSPFSHRIYNSFRVFSRNMRSHLLSMLIRVFYTCEIKTQLTELESVSLWFCITSSRLFCTPTLNYTNYS